MREDRLLTSALRTPIHHSIVNDVTPFVHGILANLFKSRPSLIRTAIPVVTDPTEAARRPELAVLSALAHGETEHGAAIAAAVLPAVAELDDERARFYCDLVLSSLNETARREVEAMMAGCELQNRFAEKYVAHGIAQGKAKVRAMETAGAVLTALRVRGIAVSDASRERILAQKDPERLERWHEKAIVATSLADVLDEPS